MEGIEREEGEWKYQVAPFVYNHLLFCHWCLVFVWKKVFINNGIALSWHHIVLILSLHTTHFSTTHFSTFSTDQNKNKNKNKSSNVFQWDTKHTFWFSISDQILFIYSFIYVCPGMPPFCINNCVSLLCSVSVCCVSVVHWPNTT